MDAQEEMQEGEDQAHPQNPAEETKEGEAAPAKGGATDSAPPVVRLVVAALKVLYGQPETTKRIVQMLKSSPNPLEGVQAATKLVIGALQRQTKGADPALFQQIAPVVASELIKIGVAAKVFDESMLEQAAKKMQPQAAPQPQAPQGIVAGAMQGEQP